VSSASVAKATAKHTNHPGCLAALGRNQKTCSHKDTKAQCDRERALSNPCFVALCEKPTFCAGTYGRSKICAGKHDSDKYYANRRRVRSLSHISRISRFPFIPFRSMASLCPLCPLWRKWFPEEGVHAPACEDGPARLPLWQFPGA
jgi:hypothetical protein